MNLLDIILIVSIGYGIFHGYKNGLLRMLSVGAGVIAGLLQTIVFMPRFTKYIQNATGWETTTSMIISFFLIMIVSVTIFYVAARLLTQLLRLININFINQIFGAVFSGYIISGTTADAITPTIDPIDIIFVRKTRPTQLPNTIIVCIGSITSKTPVVVAIPLPPLNFIKQDQV